MSEEHSPSQEHNLTMPSEYTEAKVKVTETECEQPVKLVVVKSDSAKDLQAANEGKSYSSSGQSSQSKEEDHQEHTRNQESLTRSENLQFSRQTSFKERQSDTSMDASQEKNCLNTEKQTVIESAENITGADSLTHRGKIQTFDQQYEGESTKTITEIQTPMTSQTSLNCHQSLDAKDKVVEALDKSTCLHSHSETDCLQSTVKSQSKVYTDHESQSSTRYLDDLISCIQSISDNHSETERDNVQISRAELALMVKQTLKAQTMCTYMQCLAQKNQMLNKQNEVMKETMRIWQSVEGEAQTQSLPIEAQNQIFRFDRCSLTPKSLPGGLSDQSATCSQPLPNYSSSSQPKQVSRTQSTSHECPEDLLQADGDPVSCTTCSSFQLPSQLSFDGDSLPAGNGTGVREASASGIPLLSHSMACNSAAAASTATGTLNIPHSDLLYQANSYSSGMQQHEENATGNAGVSTEQCDLMMQELVKSKMFLFNVCKNGSFHPDILMELRKLREENSLLKTELINMRSRAHVENATTIIKRLQDELKEKDRKFQKQKELQHTLMTEMTKFGEENMALKSAQESEKVHSSLMKGEIENLQSRLLERNAHCTELEEECAGLIKQHEQLKKTSVKYTDRCKYMESKLNEERQRWARDEKHMVNQIKEDVKTIKRLESLVVAVDTAWKEGKLLQQSQTQQIAALQKGNKPNSPHAMQTNSADQKSL